MTPLIHPQLVNDPFGDPALYLEFQFQRRAMLFDLGDLQALSPRKILRVHEAFVSHMHMDHFGGFDRLLRICLGREKTLRLFGPPGFVDKVAHKLAAYEWNLVHKYATDLTIEAAELDTDGTLATAIFRCRSQFCREPAPARPTVDGILLDEADVRVRTVMLDHDIPSLAFSVEETSHVNVWKNRLEEMGFGVGPWLRDAKAAIGRGDPDETEIVATWRENRETREARCRLGSLKEHAITVTPGQKIAYVVDAVHSPANAEKIIALAAGADTLFIEAMFQDRDSARAAARFHLTACQAGNLARRAGVRRMVLFHFSPRYTGSETLLRREAEAAFAGRHFERPVEEDDTRAKA